MNRRDFLKIAGAATATATLAACVNKTSSGLGEIAPEGHHTDAIPADKRIYRTDPKTSLHAPYPTIPCIDCKNCMPCPYGIDIPAIFVHYNKCVNKGNVPENQQAANYREARRAYLVGYDRAVPKTRQADHCISCGACVFRCPQEIRIPEEMCRIDELVEKLKQNTL